MWWAALFAFFGVAVSAIFYFVEKKLGFVLALGVTGICGIVAATLTPYAGAYEGWSVLFFAISLFIMMPVTAFFLDWLSAKKK
ncbi:MAG: hypothetical protein AAB527_02275 [Patescibacteria group bacterium]